MKQLLVALMAVVQITFLNNAFAYTWQNAVGGNWDGGDWDEQPPTSGFLNGTVDVRELGSGETIRLPPSSLLLGNLALGDGSFTLDGGVLGIRKIENASNILTNSILGRGTLRSIGGGVLAVRTPPAETVAEEVELGDIVHAEDGSMRAFDKPENAKTWIWRFDDENHLGKNFGGMGCELTLNDVEAGDEFGIDSPGLKLKETSEVVGSYDRATGFPVGRQPFSVSLWVKISPECTTPNMAFLSWGVYNADIGGCVFHVRTGKNGDDFSFGHIRFLSQHRNANFSLGAGNVLNDGKWHNIIGVYENDHISLYYDGVDKGRFEFGTLAVADTGPLKIGEAISDPSLAKAKFTECIDNVCVFNYELTPLKIEMLQLGRDWKRLSDTAHLKASLNGTHYLPANQTVGVISGNGIRGGIHALGGREFVVGGVGAETSTVFNAEISGDTGFVKAGADYRLTLKGKSSYTGKTEVRAGLLELDAGRQVSPCLFRWSWSGQLNGRNGGCTARNVVSAEDTERGVVAKFTNGEKSNVSYQYDDDDNMPRGNCPYTVSVRFKMPQGSTNLKGVLVAFGENSSRRVVILRCADAADKMDLIHWDNDYTGITLPQGKVLNDGEWHHVVLIRDVNNNERIYFDGLACTYGNNEVVHTDNLDLRKSGTLWIGTQQNAADARYFDGNIDDVRIYDRALALEEVGNVGSAIIDEFADRGDFELETILPKPVLHYAFEDETNVGKNSGTAGNAFDLAPVNRNEGAQPLAELVSSPIGGKMLKLSDGQTRLEVGACPESIAKGANRTVAFWARVATTQFPISGVLPKIPFIAFGGRGEGSNYFNIDMGNGNPFRLLGRDASGQAFELMVIWRGQDVALNHGTENLRWHHIAVTTDQNKSMAYLDGILFGEVQSAPGADLGTDFLAIGGRYWFADEGTDHVKWGLKGEIDEMKVFDVKLTERQIKELIRLESGRGVASVLPDGTPVEISEGATLRVANAIERIGGLNGVGVLDIDRARIMLSGSKSVFDGEIVGDGLLTIADGANLTVSQGLPDFEGGIVLDGGALDAGNKAVNCVVRVGNNGIVKNAVCPVEVAEGGIFELDDATALPFVKVDGAVSFGALTVKWTSAVKPQKQEYELFAGTSAAGSVDAVKLEGFGGFTDTPKIAKVGNKVVLRIIQGGTLLLVR